MAASQSGLELPSSAETVSVSLIDTGARLDLPAEQFMTPKITGYDRLAVPSYSFLITHPSGERLLFDLSLRKDFQNLAPPFRDICTDPESGWKVYSPRSVSDLLVENSIPLEEINAIIWSHYHFDHIGDPSLFPSTTDLVVGPTFISRFAPGYPEKPDAPVRSSDWRGRSLREMDFDQHPGKVTIGRFKAIDWFGDGSFYLLHTPGHTPEHMCGLARVQSDSFILMGADCAHHPGEFRPSKQSPIPEIIQPSPLPSHPQYGTVCPGHIFAQLGSKPGSADTPFFIPAPDYTHDFDECCRSVHGIAEFDASEQVLVLIAHDHTMLSIFKGEEDGDNGWFFPKRSLDKWREAGLKNKGKWLFLEDFEVHSTES
ncbi:metallo-beta-lactamase superfamily protein [Aspergillus costaricaensis CBS 115574]|uniref:Metallo-beta-lactamase superfamily protein n=1 Tax=Aspergillus costaricaensis CBS 115574 TaxID=1448317 RepID=A0ACD1IJN8_9EURO|nr:metallo-beta-lactamase superfamily protein [Aspergillus costaricaensis CBS 115574]RAK90825.1 metallo-beta-lactamase superfamily protein [Aspergillus costaricaensis CBS 115574]